MAESLKILMLSYWFPPKIAPAPYELAKNLAKLGHEVFVFSGTFDHATADEELDGIHVIRFEQHFPSIPGHVIYGLKANKKLSALHSSERFDVIHAQGADGWFLSQLGMESKFDIPIIVTMHGSARQELIAFKTEGPHSLRSLLERTHWKAQYYLDQWSLEGADRVIAVSKQTAMEVAEDYGIPPETIAVIFNGVDINRFSPKKSSFTLKEKFGMGFILLYVGRLRMRKGVQYLIKALPLILKERNDVRLVVVGEGEAKGFLKKLAHDVDVDENVMFVGRVLDDYLPAYYASSDVFICPSLYDPFPLVCLEALASGRPIVLTDRVGVKEIVNEDVARIVAARNERALARAILELLSDESKRKSMGGKARKLVEKYDWINIAKKTCEVYRNA